ncbi:4-hydroxy-3-polyprenylbenzoate decarboxylase [Butyrivibrio fibrisolvens]|uniref:Flavin prenyltransferase UbiX n=1 Tax=Butyrivibrio fibrisolvens TaxID=831 RepID=A0A1H9VFR2_BUTFI|nr:UbiX family flavin prenyltransferase [Butyrivibrio fibrisolvens]SES20418.1 4-hydroxy-3-polyprenylbenzoate decarboxylase [Butyrivibrio fibrisolvens]
MRLIVGVTGASGVEMSYYLLRCLREKDNMEIHLIVTEGAKTTWEYESKRPLSDLTDLADYVHDEKNLAAAVSSGSFLTDGMIIMPCSMKTLAGIVSGYADNLVQRAADVCLKEGRKLALVPREMPLSKVHLRNLTEAANLGCSIIPPVLTFYNNPQTIEDMVIHVVGKVLMQFGISIDSFKAWQGENRDE